MDINSLVDEKTVVQSAQSNQSWKHSIVDYLMAQKGHKASITDVMEATDSKYEADGSNYSSRKHCLDSQKTYMRKMFETDKKAKFVGIHAEYSNEEMVILGAISKADGKVYALK